MNSRRLPLVAALLIALMVIAGILVLRMRFSNRPEPEPEPEAAKQPVLSIRPEPELPGKLPVPDAQPEAPPPGFAPVQPDEVPPQWINNKPQITFDSLSAVSVKVSSAPRSDEFGNFGPGVPNLDPYLQAQASSYQIAPGGLKLKAMPYTDRKYEILELPSSLGGATLVQTRNGHKGVTDGRFAIVLAVDQPAFLFLAVDERMVRIWGREGAPEWVRDFSPTGYRIVTDDPTMHELRPYQVAAKKIAAGEVRLGPPWTQRQRVPAHSMYFVFLGRGQPKP